MSPKRLRASIKTEQICNGPSLLSLPTELILHIASTYPRVDYWEEQDFVRRDALKALSQTCRALRNIFLHLLWECFETVHYPSNRSHDYLKFLAEKLERLSKGLLENPEIAAHVRIAVLAIPDAVPCTYLIPCLHSLVNLYTLDITLYGSRYYDLFLSARLPQIHTLKTDDYDAPLLIRCCPNVRVVVANQAVEWCDFKGVFDENEKCLEALEGFMLSEDGVKNIVKSAPNLRRISFLDWIPPETLGLLRPLSHLQTITMYANDECRYLREPKSADELDAWMATAVSVLRGNEVKRGSDEGKKRVNMHYKWMDYIHEDGDDQSETVERIEEIEVE